MATKKATGRKVSVKPGLTKLTRKQIAELDKNLTNFIGKVRDTGTLPIGGLLAGHSSHFQQ